MTPTPPTQAVEITQREGIKETVESIVIALILAFVFRAFIVEAFVIPTGSMAPTLYGAHGTISCSDCGYEFAYGVKDLQDSRRTVPIRGRSKAICPNCNHPNTNLKINDEKRNAERGDRILVLKWPFDFGGDLLGPARWDVVVFKDPSDGVTNFIKRMVGLPNEVLMIVDGDLYTVSTDDLSEHALAEMEKLRHEKYELRAGISRKGYIRPVPRDVLEELDAKLTIARKTPAAQQALWHTVYDHDYPPRERDANQPYWRRRLGDESGWNADHRRVVFDDRGAEDDGIELAGKEIRASCAYNINRTPPPPVTDVRVQFVLTPKDTAATIQIGLQKNKRGFWATVSMDGQVSISESAQPPTDETPVMIGTQIDPLSPDVPVKVSFEVLDYRLTLRIGDQDVLTSSNDRESPAYLGPNLSERRWASRPTPGANPRIYASDGGLELTHLVIDRDEYYFHGHNAGFRALSLPWAGSAMTEGWGGPTSPILLREGEFFMLGDNTSASKDSRLWDVWGKHMAARGEDFQLGTVPEDQLIGKAFFVYWPSGHRVSWLPNIGDWNWPIIPDAGRMRWIR